MLLTREGGQALESRLLMKISMKMAAVGTPAELVVGGANDVELAFSDALLGGHVRRRGGRPRGAFKAGTAAVTRFRTGLKGSRALHALARPQPLTRSVEVRPVTKAGMWTRTSAMDESACIFLRSNPTRSTSPRLCGAGGGVVARAGRGAGPRCCGAEDDGRDGAGRSRRRGTPWTRRTPATGCRWGAVWWDPAAAWHAEPVCLSSARRSAAAWPACRQAQRAPP